MNMDSTSGPIPNPSVGKQDGLLQVEIYVYVSVSVYVYMYVYICVCIYLSIYICNEAASSSWAQTLKYAQKLPLDPSLSILVASWAHRDSGSTPEAGTCFCSLW